MDNKIKTVLRRLNVFNPQNNNQLANLYKIPTQNKLRLPTIQVESPGMIYQADLLFLPNDNGYRYALVVVDVNSHEMDAEPLKTKDNKTVLEAFKRIFGRQYLKLPKFSIQVDDGSEFKGSVRNYFIDKNIFVRVSAPNRHRQQAIVEWMNKIVGKILFILMTNEELINKEVSTEWVDELPKVVKQINKVYHQEVEYDETITPKTTKDENILPVGTLVRVALDAPIHVHDNKRLDTKFRAGDIRWTIQPKRITDVRIVPGQPIFYVVEGYNNNYFTRDQIQLYSETEIKPKPIVRKWEVERLVNRFKRNGKIFFKVKWKGYDLTTDEPRNELFKDIPEMVLQFERR